MKVFKFGASSLADAVSVQQLGKLMNSFPGEKIIVIISAAGTTTLALEKVAEAFYHGKKEEALTMFEGIKSFHVTLARHLLVKGYNEALVQLSNFFTEVEWMLHDKPVRVFEYYYDQIVCTGELLSSCIVSAFLDENGHSNQWFDVRDIIRTDNSFKAAVIDWNFTTRTLSSVVENTLLQYNVMVTQGFIASTDENESTTLGRNGKDYTAAVFANILHADSLTLWKDVDGLIAADPARFVEASSFAEVNYLDAMKMALYGAKVINAKTIGLVQQKNIPLHIRSFMDLSRPGTLVSQKTTGDLAPITIFKEGQVVLNLQSPGAAFIHEELAEQFFRLLRENMLSPKLVQVGPLNITCCLDDEPAQVEQLALAASNLFEVQVEKGLTILTILQGDESLFRQMIRGKQVVLMQQSGTTMHAVWRE